MTKEEAKALLEKLGIKLDEIVAQIQASTRPIPTEEELFAELPAIELDREELKA